MRRADRLFQIIQFMRRRGVTTAAALADALEVSERTVYRDVRDLVLSGVPIDGEAGVGYRLRKGFDLPPLMFTATELEALVLGTRVVMSWADPALANAAQSALARIEAALPEELRSRLDTPLFAPGFHVRQDVLERMGVLRVAIDERRKVAMDYRDVEGSVTQRTVRPLALAFWGSVWSLTAWCELRNDFRSFRLDRAGGLQPLAERFVDEPGKTIEDYLRGMEEASGTRPV
ncbi:MAG TPA: YafY family protein [Dehalococcoidia bacterium]|nr:YafY family protein [Dehalococcoidia bacterium]